MAITLGELAAALGAELVRGDPETPVAGVAGLDNAGPGHVAYVENARRLEEAERGPAAALIAPPSLQSRRKPLLRVPNPRLAFARALGLFAPAAPPPVGIHPTAVIGSGVALGEGVSIGPHAVIGDDCRIGDRARIHALASIGRGAQVGPESEVFPNVTIYDGVSLGARVIVHAGAVIGSVGFGYAQDGEAHISLPHIGTVIVEDDVEIGANVTIDRATTGATVIGQGTKIDNLVHIAHNVTIGRHCLLAGQVGISGSVTLGDHVVLAGQVGVADHVVLGDAAQAGARAAIIGDVPAGAVVWGYPARKRGEQLRIEAATSRLPELVRALQDLKRRLSALEVKLRGG